MIESAAKKRAEDRAQALEKLEAIVDRLEQRVGPEATVFQTGEIRVYVGELRLLAEAAREGM